jgi:hypothetical protein
MHITESRKELIQELGNAYLYTSKETSEKIGELIKALSSHGTYMSENISELTKALSSAQGQFKGVLKEKSGHNYKYAELNSYLESIRDPLSTNNLAITQVISEDGAALITYLLHESGQWIRSFFPLKANSLKSGNEIQAFGSVISYARRYSIAAILRLAQEDDDHQSHKGSSNYKHEPMPPLPPINKQLPASPLSDDKITKKLTLLTSLKNLCKDTGINIIEFGKFFGLNSENVEQLQDAIDNFADLADQFKAKQ